MTAVTWHLLRGVGAAAPIVAVLFPHGIPSWAPFLLLPATVMLLRGCPMCWLLGLAKRLRVSSPQRD